MIEHKSRKPRPTLGIYPVTGENQNEIISILENNCHVHNLPNIEFLIPNYNIGYLNVKEREDYNNILKNYRKANKDLVIASINRNFVIEQFDAIKNLPNILNEKQDTINISSFAKQLNQRDKFDLEGHISDIIFILSVIFYKQRDKIVKMIFDDNNLSRSTCLINVPYYFDHLNTISVKGNPLKKVILKKENIKIIYSNDNDNSSKNSEENKSKKERNKEDQQSHKNHNDEVWQSQKNQNDENKQSCALLPTLNTRFNKWGNEEEDSDDQYAQDQHFREMMYQLFNSDLQYKDNFYDQSAVFSFTISKKISSKNSLLIQFLKANECNLFNISNASHKWLGYNLFFQRPDIFQDGLQIPDKRNFDVLPTVAIGDQLYSVVVATTLRIKYKYLKNESIDDVNTIHTFTIRSDGEFSQILSHQIFFYE